MCVFCCFRFKEKERSYKERMFWSFGVKKVTKANVFVGKRRSEAKAHSDKLTKRPIGEWGPLFRIIVRSFSLYEVYISLAHC